IASVLVMLVSVAITGLLLVNRQYILDSISVWQYSPTPEITAFVERTSMSDTGEFLFYASQPSLEGSQAFNDKCSRVEKSTAILGCYNGRSIFVYDVPNPKLDGIREVTSAHEMLHAAYDRLNDAQQAAVDKLVEDEYAKLSGDAEFAERMAFYARTEPGERDNELHSIIGTEVASVSPELEAHYKKYFDDRSKVVALHAKYASVFASLQARGGELSAQLTAIATSIDQRTGVYNSSVEALNADIAAFNKRAASGGFSTQAQFNAERSGLIAKVSSLEDLRASIDRDRKQYEALREELTSIASESETLNKSIDSNLAPAPSI
ncbi:MAG: hypothetical protein ABWX90_03410, partial [Candidatus Saccharimonadales bacterium]